MDISDNVPAGDRQLKHLIICPFCNSTFFAGQVKFRFDLEDGRILYFSTEKGTEGYKWLQWFCGFEGYEWSVRERDGVPVEMVLKNGSSERVSPLRVCANDECNQLLSGFAGFYEPGNGIFFLGLKGTGKTVMITTLIETLRRRAGRFKAVFSAYNRMVKEEYEENYYRPVYQERVLPAATITHSRLTFEWLNTVNNRAADLTFSDIRGEDADDLVKIFSGKMGMDIQKSRGFIVTIDLESMISNPIMKEKNVSIFSEVLQKAALYQRERKYLAVVLTKSDRLANRFDYPIFSRKSQEVSPVYRQLNYEKEPFELSGRNEINEGVRQVMQRVCPQVVTAAEQVFQKDHVAYFAVSALGSAPEGQHITGETPMPIRVEEPALWMLMEMGLAGEEKTEEAKETYICSERLLEDINNELEGEIDGKSCKKGNKLWGGIAAGVLFLCLFAFLFISMTRGGGNVQMIETTAATPVLTTAPPESLYAEETESAHETETETEKMSVEPEQSDRFEWNGFECRKNSNGKVTIESYISPLPEYVVIPATISQMPVAGIGDGALKDSDTVVNIEIEEGVRTIGAFAFQGCAELKSIKIPNSVKEIKANPFQHIDRSIDVQMDENQPYFEVRNGCLINKSNKKLISFLDIESETANVPDGIKIIGECAFMDHKSLKQVWLPESLTKIQWYAFAGCASMTYINLPSNLTILESNVFYDCSALENLILPKNLHLIGDETFMWTGITNLTIPPDVWKIEGNPFKYSSLSSITVDEANPYLQSIENKFLLADHKLISYVGREDVRVIVPDTITVIGDDAFINHEEIEQIILPENLYSIDDSAFAFNNSLKSIEIPEHVEIIRYGAFYSCMDLAAIKIPDSVTEIGDNILKWNPTVIYCNEGSHAMEYAENNGIEWRKIEEFPEEIPDGIKLVSKE